MTITMLKGDCRDVLRTLPNESVHCVVTSPPYWGLRDYGTAKWEGGDPNCEHKVRERQSIGTSTLDGGKSTISYAKLGFREQCPRCGAHRIDSQIGLEQTPEEYTNELVAVFREVRRVLRKDGVCWLNLGDSYSGGKTGRADTGDGDLARRAERYGTGVGAATGPREFKQRAVPDGLKPKDLCGIPWRVAFALQADGWWLRQDIIWSKPNPMPESVTDRCTKAHEYLFLLSKSERYYYDAEAIKEDAVKTGSPAHLQGGNGKRAGTREGLRGAQWDQEAGRNKRSVWEIATAPFPEAHFATFPPALIEPCVLAGCPKECCAKCGAPWVREVEKTRTFQSGSGRSGNMPVGKNGSNLQGGGETLDIRRGPCVSSETVGWSLSCSCNSGTVPGTCLDPFGGAGTTGLVADRLGRNAILIELNPEYAAMAERRIKDDAGMFAEIG